eukprot:TRINITY_DN11251_c0_g1_i1.p2 TRINITY_DN11251_c0_g1~~TRINITY_DN11251_c0_g1_i1.p2  ORF type:complete len:136 (-),score=47.22 TRINITY_DN11251_c0_g1_i1:125-499(-)
MEVLESGMKELRSLQKEHEQLEENKRQYMVSANENEMVAKELALLEDDAVVYKMIGPALVRQEVPAAKQTVQTRLEFIKSEMQRIDKRAAEIQKTATEKRDKLMKLQQRLNAERQQQMQRAQKR